MCSNQYARNKETLWINGKQTASASPVCLIWRASQNIFPAIFQYQCDCRGQTFLAFLDGLSLTVCTRNFGAIRYVPFAILFHHHRKFIGQRMSPEKIIAATHGLNGNRATAQSDIS